MRRFLFFFAIYMCAQLSICAENDIDANSEMPTEYQKLEWKAIKNAKKYEVEIQHCNDSWTTITKIETNTNSAEFYLIAGKYRFSIAVYNILNQKVSTSEWIPFTVLPAYQPFIFDKSFDTVLGSDTLILDFDAVAANGVCERTIKGRNIFSSDATFVLVPLINTETGGIDFPRITSACPEVMCTVIARDLENNALTLSFDATKIYTGYYKLVVTNPGGYSHSVEFLAHTNRVPIITGNDFVFSRRYNMRTLSIKRDGTFFSQTLTADFKNGNVELNEYSLTDATLLSESTPVPATVKAFVVTGFDFLPDMVFSLVPDINTDHPFMISRELVVVPCIKTELLSSNKTESKLNVYFDTARLQTGFYRLVGTCATGIAELPLLITVTTAADDAPVITKLESDLDTTKKQLELYLSGTNLSSNFKYTLVSFCLNTGKNIRIPLFVRNVKKDSTAMTLAADAELIPAAGTYAVFVENNDATFQTYIKLKSDFSVKLIELTQNEVEETFLQPVDMTIDNEGEKWINDMPMEVENWKGFFTHKGNDITDKMFNNPRYFMVRKNADNFLEVLMRNNGAVINNYYESNFSQFILNDVDGYMKNSDTIIFKLNSSRRRLYWRVEIHQVLEDGSYSFDAPLKVKSGTTIVEMPYSDFKFRWSSNGRSDVTLDPSRITSIAFSKECTQNTAGGGEISVSEIKVYDSAKCKEFREEKLIEPVNANVLSIDAEVADFTQTESWKLRAIGLGIRAYDMKFLTADIRAAYNYDVGAFSVDAMANLRKTMGLFAIHGGVGAGYCLSGITDNVRKHSMYIPIALGFQLFDLLDFTYRFELDDIGGVIRGDSDFAFSQKLVAGFAFRIRPPYTEKAPLLSSGIIGMAELTAPVIKPIVATSLFITSRTTDVTEFVRYSYGAALRLFDFNWTALDIAIDYDFALEQVRADSSIVLAIPSDTFSPYIGAGVGYCEGLYAPVFCGITWFNVIDTRLSANITGLNSGSTDISPMLGIGLKIQLRKPIRLLAKKENGTTGVDNEN